MSTVAHVNVDCPKFNSGDDAQRWLTMTQRAIRLALGQNATEEARIDFAIMHLQGTAQT